jgi:acetyl esterase/lipase
MSDLTRRDLLLSGCVVAAVSAVVPATARYPLPPQPVAPVDPLSLVNPELRSALDPVLKWTGPHTVNATNLDEARKPRMPSTPMLAPASQERFIPGAKGAPDVRVFVINAAPTGAGKPAILHIHGGGFITGRASDAVPALQRVAREHDCVIVTVDYRLAPETRFPGALDDNYAALKWLHDSATPLGVNSSRIALMGESSGGGHAAMLAIAARDRGEVKIAFQLLLYPMLDDRTGSSRPAPAHLGAYIWLRPSNQFGWSSLLGVSAGSRIVPAGAVPARVQNLSGLPPTFIGVGSIDLFVEEDMDYARRLIDAGVPTELCVVPGAYHGFDAIAPTAPVSKAFRSTWNTALANAFAMSSRSLE